MRVAFVEENNIASDIASVKSEAGDIFHVAIVDPVFSQGNIDVGRE